MNKNIATIVIASVLIVLSLSIYGIMRYGQKISEIFQNLRGQVKSSSEANLVTNSIEPSVEVSAENESKESEEKKNNETKLNCANQAMESIKEKGTKGLSAADFAFVVNTFYRLCLVKSGLPPEDLLSYPSTSQKNQGSSSQTYETPPALPQIEQPSIPSPSVTQPLYDLEADKRERCQNETNKYNSCMSEYNAKLGEYNSCMMSKATNPYMFCSKPFNSCFKPFCNF